MYSVQILIQIKRSGEWLVKLRFSWCAFVEMNLWLRFLNYDNQLLVISQFNIVQLDSSPFLREKN